MIHRFKSTSRATQRLGHLRRDLTREGVAFSLSLRHKRGRRRRRQGCGCSSGVEHNLAKVGVEGSNPFARSKFLFKIKVLPMGDPEERFVHWRAIGAKRVE